ncbi:hypothetical protein F441_04470 [Phytophthora nicotianae CJ01A1]|uniref:Uncharacterized protein n=4 Tax=Phytophthora nicotianae TaxID=4792 RepID=W2QHW2_PHYN3|nr:hypothetical protein PPTG_22399 [Phytophthora nicotianae INRA-310]ETL45605.1 hypothetical protein L916_04336 [Phytophthora nicotianae]ETN12752.1 hypothetical protein PPTG_22399 [Phytophthora nicotianae INRA-310]ETP22160.1 hypothetical protein F441_04470 [Phytophthora nicotianae CJ01A1]ETP50067.1 hypothetical protein F442_04530 [Phytophthora nicotianae P10297]
MGRRWFSASSRQCAFCVEESFFRLGDAAVVLCSPYSKIITCSNSSFYTNCAGHHPAFVDVEGLEGLDYRIGFSASTSRALSTHENGFGMFLRMAENRENASGVLRKRIASAGWVAST